MYVCVNTHINYCRLFSSPSPLLLQRIFSFSLPYYNNDFVITYHPGSTVDISKISSWPDQCAAEGNKMFMRLPSFLWSTEKLSSFLIQILRKRSEAVNNSHCCYRRALTFCNSQSRNNKPSISPLFGSISPMTHFAF